MYNVTPIPVRIIVYERDGKLYHYDSYTEFLLYAKYFISHLGDNPKHQHRTYYYGEDISMYYRYWVKDEFGNEISRDKILEDLPRRKRHIYYPHTVYREDPVPNTGKHKGGYATWWKHPRTTQEMREYYKLEVEKMDTGYPIHYRAKRTPHYLPTAWDDVIKSRWGNRCWKKFRQKQYKD